MNSNHRKWRAYMGVKGVLAPDFPLKLIFSKVKKKTAKIENLNHIIQTESIFKKFANDFCFVTCLSYSELF